MFNVFVVFGKEGVSQLDNYYLNPLMRDCGRIFARYHQSNCS